MLFCQYPMGANAISEGQKTAIVERCDSIKDSLKNLQKLDARTRVFFGSRFEMVISKFVTALNVRLVENGLTDAGLIDSQNELTAKKAAFSENYVSYQQGLETLVGIDCRTEPERFYEQLGLVREMRKKVAGDVTELKSLTAKSVELVRGMREDF